MAKKILQSPHPILRKMCAEVEFPLAPSHLKVAIELKATLEEHGGAMGLAANQIGYLSRIIAMRVPGRGIVVMCNPKVLFASDQPADLAEGCLSLPRKWIKVKRRSNAISVSYRAFNGKEDIIQLHGIHAVCVQHEIDHLNGTLMTDYQTKESP